MSNENIKFSESVRIIKEEPKEDISMNRDGAKWKCKMHIEKYNSDESYDKGVPDEIQEVDGNTALYTGLALIWRLANGQGELDPTNNYYLNSDNTFVGVGNSSATAAPTQEGLLGTSVAYKEMDQTTGTEYPLILDNTITVRAKFGPTEANFAWNEWGILNGDPTNTEERPLSTIVQMNRKVEPMGTKVSGATWVVVADLSINP